jgi:hypothetical protein
MSARDAREARIAKLDRAAAFARECASDGPEYGDDDAAYAFALVADVLRSHEPQPAESAEAYLARVYPIAIARVAAVESPATFEALSIVGPGSA